MSMFTRVSTQRCLISPLFAVVTGLWVGTAQAQPFAYVSNGESSTVSVIDTATNTVVATIPVGTGPAGLAVTSNGTRVYVATGDTVSVIDTMTNAVIAVVPLGSGAGNVAVNPAGTRVYVTHSGELSAAGTVSVIDATTNTVIATI
jgi:YVTN family beta-propeller protein